jgi:hypothetical protein
MFLFIMTRKMRVAKEDLIVISSDRERFGCLMNRSLPKNWLRHWIAIKAI